MTNDYSMYTEAGNRLIHNRVMTVKRKVNDALTSDEKDRTKAITKALNAVEAGIKSYANMRSEKHPEHSDTAVRECFLYEMEGLVADIIDSDRNTAYTIVSTMWNR